MTVFNTVRALNTLRTPVTMPFPFGNNVTRAVRDLANSNAGNNSGS